MSKNIKETIRKNLNTLLETKGFEHMEVAFGVKEKSDNLSDAEKKQFGEMETIQDEKGVKLGDASVQPALNKVHKEDKKDEEAYFKDVEKKMKDFQKTEKSEPSQIGESIEESTKEGLEMRLKDCLKRCSEDEDPEGCERALCGKIKKEMGEPVNEIIGDLREPDVKKRAINKILDSSDDYTREELEKLSLKDLANTLVKAVVRINEAFDPPKVNREDDQTEPEEVYSTEALGPGMLALRYDNRGTEVHKKFEERVDDLNGDDLTYKKLKGYGQKYLKHKYEDPDEYHYTPKVRVTDKSINETYMDVLEENIFKVKGTIKSKEQVIDLVDRLPERVKIDETVFAVTDGENEYRLIWEGQEDGEAIITHEKNVNIVNENINKMKHLWEFKSSTTTTNRKTIKENDDVFFKMMNKVRGKETLNEAVAVDAKANKSTIKKLADELSNDADLGAKCRQLIKKDGDCSQELKDLAKDNPNDSDLGAACREMCK